MTKNNNKISNQQEAIEYFRLSIIDAKLAYTLFKSLYLSRAESIVGKILAEKYFWTQKQHGGFFVLVEHCAFISFIVKILYGFDNDSRSLTLKDIDSQSYSDFISREDNKKIIEKLKKLRNKRIAHYDKKIKITPSFPSFQEIDSFFKRLEKFYDKLVKKIENASIIRKQDQDLKNDLEKVLQNLYVGEKIRLLGIDIEFMWDEDPKKISKNGKI